MMQQRFISKTSILGATLLCLSLLLPVNVSAGGLFGGMLGGDGNGNEIDIGRLFKSANPLPISPCKSTFLMTE